VRGVQYGLVPSSKEYNGTAQNGLDWSRVLDWFNAIML
jgi:hypothetical protein